MLYKGDILTDVTELFNVDGIADERGGLRLMRYPSYLKKFLSAEGADMAEQGNGCEIRFVIKGNGEVRVKLEAIREGSAVLVYRGDRLEGRYAVAPKCSIVIGMSPYEKLTSNDFCANDSFSADVVRIIIQGGYVVLESIEAVGCEIRPPKGCELPRKTMLAYGSSITHGARSDSTELVYTHIAARLLAAQVLNKGLASSCLCEKEVADYFAENAEYDFMLMEHGTNICGYYEKLGCGEDEIVGIIRDRGRYMLGRMLEKNPDKYIFVTAPLCLRNMYERPEYYKRLSDAVHGICDEQNSRRCIFIPIEKIEASTGLVTCDFIHPSTEGHALMGVNLANIMREYIER